MHPPFDDLLTAVLYMKRALLGTVIPALRAVTIDLDIINEIYICYFYYDGPITDERFDLASSSACEASDSWYCKEHIVQLDYPNLIPIKGVLVYLRKESNLIPPKIQFLSRSNCTFLAYLSYALQQGLLGRVVPSLRAALIAGSDDEKKLEFYFYYNEPVSDELRNLSQEAIQIAQNAFSQDYTSSDCIEFIPFPKEFSDFGKRLVYLRKE